MLRLKSLLIALIATATIVIAAKSSDQLQIGVKYRPDECPMKTRNGDKLSMQ